MKTKRVEWSYPTSPNADRFKKPNGCWTVEIVSNGNPPKAVAAFDSLGDARMNCEQIPLPWDALTK